MITLICLGITAGCSLEPESSNHQADPSSYAPMPDLGLWCDYFYLVDIDTGQVLMDVRSDEKMYPASMTKIMTSILAIERIPDPENVTIEFTAEMMEGLVEASANRAGFVVGDEPTALDHIYGDLLPSGADCSRALAFYISGDEESFVELMNRKAEALNMKDTHFENTSGLHDDDHYTTCQDMMTLYLYCLKNPRFAEIIQTEEHVSVPVQHYPRGLSMTNFVLMYVNQEKPRYNYNFEIPGFIGGKSGYTIEGQYTLVSHASVNGMNLALVNAHGYNEPHYPASIEDAAVIYNWYRTHFERTAIVKEGTVWETLPVRNTMAGDVEVVVKDTIDMDLPNDENLHVYTELNEALSAPFTAGEAVGKISVYAYDQKVAETDLIAAESRSATAVGRLNTVMEDITRSRIWIVSMILLSVLFVLLFQMAVSKAVPIEWKRKRHRRKKRKRIHRAEQEEESAKER